MASQRTYLDTGAHVSEDGLFRYSLWRRLAPGKRVVTFVGLNPSTADATRDDPTVRRCVGFARDWNFDWLYMANLYGFRATDPRDLDLARDPVGPMNEAVLRELVGRSELVVAAWGAHPLNAAAAAIAEWVMSLEQARCLGTTKNGSPRHPLYVRADTRLVRPW